MSVPPHDKQAVDSPTRLLIVSLAAGARLVASHVLPGPVNNLPFEWENLKRLKGKRVSIWVSTPTRGMSVASVAAGND